MKRKSIREFFWQKDIAEKTLLDWKDVFADVFNSLLFNGEQIMQPEELENVSPHSAGLFLYASIFFMFSMEISKPLSISL